MPTTTATILTHKLKNPDFAATATDSAVWMPLAEIQKTEKDWEGTVSSSYQLLFSGNLKNDSVTLDNLQPKYAASNYYKNNIPTSSPDQDLTHYLTIPDSAITEGTIASNAVTARTITAAAVTAGAIATAAVTAGAIAENQIYNRHIASIGEGTDGIDGQKIQNSSLTLNKIDTKLKGILINSVNPDNMIIGQTPKNILEFSLNDYSFTLSRGQITYTFYLTTYYSNQISPTFFMKFLNIDNVYSLEIPRVIIACHTEDSSSDFLYSNPPIITDDYFTFKENDDNIIEIESISTTNQYPNFKILSEEYFKQYINEFWTAFINYITPIQEIDLDVNTGTVSRFSFPGSSLSRDWNWYADTVSVAVNSMDPLYTSYSNWLNFKNTMYLSQDDYDKLGIWIKI